MKNIFMQVLLLALFLYGCQKDNNLNEEVQPDPHYPYTYSILSKQELESKQNEFNRINKYPTLSLNEFGILTGYVPVDLTSGLDSSIVKQSISSIINSYGNFLGIGKECKINIDSDLSIRLNGGVNVSLSHYFKYKLNDHPTFVLRQHELSKRSIDNCSILFAFISTNNRMEINGRWFYETFVPDQEIKNVDEAINSSIQYIKDQKLSRSIDFTIPDKSKIEKIIFPYYLENKIELRECWKIIFWNSQIETLVDTQTGEIVFFLDLSDMI